MNWLIYAFLKTCLKSRSHNEKRELTNKSWILTSLQTIRRSYRHRHIHWHKQNNRYNFKHNVLKYVHHSLLFLLTHPFCTPTRLWCPWCRIILMKWFRLCLTFSLIFFIHTQRWKHKKLFWNYKYLSCLRKYFTLKFFDIWVASSGTIFFYVLPFWRTILKVHKLSSHMF